jgi:cell division FtsZ-interacting protein ZapD
VPFLRIYLHPDPELLRQLDRIETYVAALLGRVTIMSEQLDSLAREVQEMGGVVDSAITLIGGLAAQIRDLKTDPAALEALAAELDAKAGQLAAAVSANTPPAEGPGQPEA